mmetsp:Transcript_9245/g.26290  ORF Transcript_9245/g.26290 Transcript_9245/m.26290 type:complete len:257 (-) Transcript_9245:1171-1941(-)
MRNGSHPEHGPRARFYHQRGLRPGGEGGLGGEGDSQGWHRLGESEAAVQSRRGDQGGRPQGGAQAASLHLRVECDPGAVGGGHRPDVPGRGCEDLREGVPGKLGSRARLDLPFRGTGGLAHVRGELAGSDPSQGRCRDAGSDEVSGQERGRGVSHRLPDRGLRHEDTLRGKAQGERGGVLGHGRGGGRGALRPRDGVERGAGWPRNVSQAHGPGGDVGDPVRPQVRLRRPSEQARQGCRKGARGKRGGVGGHSPRV